MDTNGHEKFNLFILDNYLRRKYRKTMKADKPHRALPITCWTA